MERLEQSALTGTELETADTAKERPKE